MDNHTITIGGSSSGYETATVCNVCHKYMAFKFDTYSPIVVNNSEAIKWFKEHKQCERGSNGS